MIKLLLLILKDFSNVKTQWDNDHVPVPTKNNENISESGGIINNSGTITSIENSKFNNNEILFSINNETKFSPIYNFKGGIINNTGEIASIKNTVFENNSITAEVSGINSRLNLYGGIINNENIINEISNVKFNNNTILVSNSYRAPLTYGGIISNTGTIGLLNADMTNNTIRNDIPTGSSHNLTGGLLYNNGQINQLTGNYSNNKIINLVPDNGHQNTRGFIFNDSNGHIDGINIIFSDNTLSLENYQTKNTNLYTEVGGSFLRTQVISKALPQNCIIINPGLLVITMQPPI